MSKIYQARVTSTRNVADRVVELEFEGTTEPLPSWEPGAHTDVHLPNGLIRQYSLMRSEFGVSHWRIAVLVEEHGRGGSKYLAEGVYVGQAISVGEPRNHFDFDASPNMVLIGAGIGVTPLIAMADEAHAAGINWHLHYLGRTRNSLAYSNELKLKFGDRVILNIADEGTRLNIPELLSTTNPNANVYACGPERLLVELETILGEGDRLHLERFAPKEQIFEPNQPFTVIAERSGITFEVPADESILVAADFEGINVAGDCLEGTCGSCETLIVSGEVEHRDSILTNKQRKLNKSMMICVSRAASKTLTLDI